MKHLTILSLSAAAILFTGARFQNHFNNICDNPNKIEQVISVQVNEVKAASDSLIISAGTNITIKAAKKIERSTFKLFGKLVDSAL